LDVIMNVPAKEELDIPEGPFEDNNDNPEQ